MNASAIPNKESANDSLFPLSLVAFERYMLIDERPEYPMTFWLKLEFDGVPCQTAMNDAFAETIQRHPLLTAQLKGEGKDTIWVAPSDSLPKLKWYTAENYQQQAVRKHLDLQREGGVSGHIITSEESSSISLLFHHAACDGIGSFRFVNDLLAKYAHHITGKNDIPRLPRNNSADLKFRGTFEIKPPSPVSQYQIIKSFVSETWKQFSRHPQPVCSNKHSLDSVDQTQQPMIQFTVPSDLQERLEEKAKNERATLNDLLLRDLFLTIRQWNESQNTPMSKRWIRITMPTNMRRTRDLKMPAANMIGYAMLTRRGSDCENAQKLLSSISSETQEILKWGMGGMFIEAIRNALKVPGLLKYITHRKSCISSAVLSNLGEVKKQFKGSFPCKNGRLVAGNLTVTSFFAAPPVRPDTNIALFILKYAGKLSISLRWDPLVLNQEDSEKLFSLYLNFLEKSVRVENMSENQVTCYNFSRFM